MRVLFLLSLFTLLLSCSSKGGSEKEFDVGVRGKVHIEYRR